MIEYNKKDESVGFMKYYAIYTDDITGEMITDYYYYNVDGLMLSEDSVISLYEKEVVVDDDYVEYGYEVDDCYYHEDEVEEFLKNFERVWI